MSAGVLLMYHRIGEENFYSLGGTMGMRVPSLVPGIHILCAFLRFVQCFGLVIYCESGFQFKCFVRHVEINRSSCTTGCYNYDHQREE